MSFPIQNMQQPQAPKLFGIPLDTGGSSWMKSGQQDESSACCQSTKPEPKPHSLLQAGFLVPGSRRDPKADLSHPLHSAHKPRPRPGQLCPAKCQQTWVTWQGDGLRWVFPNWVWSYPASFKYAEKHWEEGEHSCLGQQRWPSGVPRHTDVQRARSRWHLAEGARSSLGHSGPHAGLGSSPSPEISKTPHPCPDGHRTQYNPVFRAQLTLQLCSPLHWASHSAFPKPTPST